MQRKMLEFVCAQIFVRRHELLGRPVARGDRRVVDAPDPARRLLRRHAFRGVPRAARHRPQHPHHQARHAGRARRDGATHLRRGPGPARLRAHREGQGVVARARHHPAVGRRVGRRQGQRTGAHGAHDVWRALPRLAHVRSLWRTPQQARRARRRRPGSRRPGPVAGGAAVLNRSTAGRARLPRWRVCRDARPGDRGARSSCSPTRALPRRRASARVGRRACRCRHRSS